jgi:predicted lipoprotein with Yx(FWY)xxD motif
MKSPLRSGSVIAALTLLASLAAAAASVMTSTDGMTVYTFDRDVPGSGDSACVDACAAMWPPVPAHAMPARRDISTIARDGMKQATYRDRPLYFYAGDRKPGDAAGDKQGKVWHVVPMDAGVQATTAPKAAPDTVGSAYY